jgi:hypothetical protein
MRRPHVVCRQLRRWDAVRSAVQVGLGALRRRDRGLVDGSRAYRCSVNLDEARKVAEPNASRWDYVLGTAARGIAMEVHPAKASEVDSVIAKKLWAEARLFANCELRVSRWCWVRPPGSPLQFTSLSPAARRLAKNGIRFPSSRLERPE